MEKSAKKEDNTVLIAFRLPREVHKEIKDFCKDNGILIKKVMELGGLQYVRNSSNRMEGVQ